MIISRSTTCTTDTSRARITRRSSLAANRFHFRLSEQGRWEEYSRERDLNSDIVQAVEFTLNQEAAGGGVDLVVIFDVLTIDGPIKLVGKNVSIAARKVISRNNGTIDTSGENAKANVARAQDGRTPDANGMPGAPGQAGAPAGAILSLRGGSKGLLSYVRTVVSVRRGSKVALVPLDKPAPLVLTLLRVIVQATDSQVARGAKVALAEMEAMEEMLGR